MQKTGSNTVLISVRIASMLATVIDKEIAKTVTSFLTTWNKNLHNNLSYQSYSM